MSFFKKKIGPISIWWLALIAVFCIIGITIGSFLDLNISQALAKQDTFYGKIIEQFIPVIYCTVAPIGMAILTKKILVHNTKKKYIVLSIIAIALVIVISAYFTADYFTGQPGYSWKFNKWLGLVIIVAIYTLVFFIARHFIDDEIDTKTLTRNGLIIILGFGLSMILVNTVFKGLIYRPRYRALVWDNAQNGNVAIGLEYYQPWYIFAFFKKPEWFLNLNLSSDYIKSWPSGHSAGAALLLMLPLFTSVLKKRSNKADVIVFVVGALFILATTFGRVLCGAHFLADVSSGVLLGLLSEFVPVVFINMFINKLFKEKEE